MLNNDMADYGYICDITCCWQCELDRSEKFFLIGRSSYLPARVRQLRVIFSLRMQFMIMSLVASQLRC